MSWSRCLPTCVSFALTAVVLGAPWTEENKAWNVNFNPDHKPEEYYGQWTNHNYQASPEDWRQLPVYQMLTDRFSDADPLNNEPESWMGGYDLRDHTMRHGGDFKGLLANLDYVKGLGCKVIWISPVFQNEFNEYHGYGQVDYTTIDRRWGTLEDLQALTTAAHEKGMYVIVDIVVNHLGQRLKFTDKESGQDMHGGAKFVYHKGEYNVHLKSAAQSSDGNDVYEYYDFKASNEWNDTGLYPHPDGKQYPYYAFYGLPFKDNGEKGKGGFWKSDFHHNGDLTDYSGPMNIHTGKIYGLLDDLFTEAPHVRRKIIAMTKALLTSTDIDGIRTDTPMQVDLDFFKEWIPAVRAHAKTLGKNNFGIWGEFFCDSGRMGTMVGRGIQGDAEQKDPGDPSQWLDARRGFDGGIDYMYGMWIEGIMKFEWMNRAVYGIMSNYVGSAGVKKILDFQWNRWDFTNPNMAEQKVYQQWTFCNNHDRERLQLTRCGRQKMDSCTAMFFFHPGMFIHYAGDEQGYRNPGTALNGWAREELATSVAWRGMTAEANVNGDGFDMSSDAYRRVQRLIAVRTKFWSSLKCDVTKFHAVPKGEVGFNEGGIIVWERSCEGQPPILVAVNLKASPDRVLFDVTKASRKIVGAAMGAGWVAGATLVEMISNKLIQVTAEGKLDLNFDAWEYGVFMLQDSNAKATRLPPTVTSVTPKHDAVVEDASLITVTFDDGMSKDTLKAFLHGPNMDRLALVTSHVFSMPSVAHFNLPEGTPALSAGIYRLEVPAAPVGFAGASSTMVGTFWSRFQVEHKDLRSVLAHPNDIVDHSLIDFDSVGANDKGDGLKATIVNRAPGAEWFRIRNVEGTDHRVAWNQWMKYEDKYVYQNFKWEVAVLVQYSAQGSGAYFAGACLVEGIKNENCLVSWYPKMHWFGEEGVEYPSKWVKHEMKLVDNFLWEVAVPIRPKTGGDGDYAQYKYNPAGDDKWSMGSLGVDPKYMLDEGGGEVGLGAIQKYQVEHKVWAKGVGKVQEKGGNAYYNEMCPTGKKGEKETRRCIFRLNDLNLLFAECLEYPFGDLANCYKPGYDKIGALVRDDEKQCRPLTEIPKSATLGMAGMMPVRQWPRTDSPDPYVPPHPVDPPNGGNGGNGPTSGGMEWWQAALLAAVVTGTGGFIAFKLRAEEGGARVTSAGRSSGFENSSSVELRTESHTESGNE